jgi:integrase
VRDRALWSTAFRAGLRAGEIAELDWSHVDLAKGEITVERAHDFKTKQMIDPKSESSRRVVPIDGALRDDLLEHRLRSKGSDGLV